jgi:hypothetical protein
MEEQQAFSKLLHENGRGIALFQPTEGIDVGDLCYWDSDGTATRILNVFENTQVSSLGINDNDSGLRKIIGLKSE